MALSFGPTSRPSSAKKSSTVALRMACSSCRRLLAYLILDSSIRRAAPATRWLWRSPSRGRHGHSRCDAEIQPPFNPDAATTEFSTVLRAYRVGKVIGDRYAGEWVREPFRRHGIEYQVSEATKADIYRDALPLFNASRAQLLDLKRLVNQLCSLERRTARGGRDLIDHPQHPGAHDDLANAVCGALLERDRRPQLISVSDVVGVDGLPPPLPRSECVFAAVWAAGADVAVVYGASSRW
jgi:LSD1 subclass zinc finger protein